MLWVIVWCHRAWTRQYRTTSPRGCHFCRQKTSMNPQQNSFFSPSSGPEAYLPFCRWILTRHLACKKLENFFLIFTCDVFITYMIPRPFSCPTEIRRYSSRSPGANYSSWQQHNGTSRWRRPPWYPWTCPTTGAPSSRRRREDSENFWHDVRCWGLITPSTHAWRRSSSSKEVLVQNEKNYTTQRKIMCD